MGPSSDISKVKMNEKVSSPPPVAVNKARRKRNRNRKKTPKKPSGSGDTNETVGGSKNKNSKATCSKQNETASQRRTCSIVCRIVGYKPGELVYLQAAENLDDVNTNANEAEVFVLDKRSQDINVLKKNRNIMELPITYNVRVYGLEKLVGLPKKGKKQKKRGLDEPGWRVTSFAFTDCPSVRREIVVAAKLHGRRVQVLGASFPSLSNCLHVAGPMPEAHCLLIGDVFPLKYRVEFRCIRESWFFLEEISDADSENENQTEFYMTSLRRLLRSEKNLVHSMCRDMDTLTLQQAELYIRDPLIVASRLGHYMSGLSTAKSTITVCVPSDYTIFDMAIALSPADGKRLIEDKSVRSWKIGSELQLVGSSVCAIPNHPGHSELVGIKDNEILTMEPAMLAFIVEIKQRSEFVEVFLEFTEEARERLAILERANRRLSGKICIGPRFDPVDKRSGTLLEVFPFLFGGDCERFRQITGRSAAKDFALPKLDSIQVAGHTLDASQRLGVLSALSNPYITAISAPAGSGKTLMLEGVTVQSVFPHKNGGLQEKRRVLVGATTNSAATEMIQKIHDDMPEDSQFRLCRHFSRAAEAELGESGKLGEHISLRRMSQRAEDFVDLSQFPDVKNALAKVELVRAALLSSTTVKGGIISLNELKSAQNRLLFSFYEAYRPDVFGSTVDLLSHSAHLCEDFDHLILDEAAQMDTISAFSVYGQYPQISRITLVGDSKQLAPYSELSQCKDTEVGQLYAVGELTRLENLPNVAKVRLNTIYRCHWRLTEMWLRPIYGDGLEAHVPAPHHLQDLARRKGMPRANDGTPCLLLHVIGYQDSEGVNPVELDVCLKLLYKIRDEHGVPLEDVVIICHHRAQKAAVCNRLKNTGSIGHLRLPCIVTTVDSFQGKESKVVILLTTKNGSSNDTTGRSLRFVANFNRGTVAVSRSTDVMYILGNWSQLALTDFWIKFVPNWVKSGALAQMTADGRIEPRDSGQFFRGYVKLN